MSPLLWQAAVQALTLSPRALAQVNGDPANPADPPSTNSETTRLELFNPLQDVGLGDLLDTILQGLVLLAIPIVTIMVIIGAYYMITGGGDPGKIKKGKDYVIWAAIGFAVLLLASSVTSIITNFLTPTV